MRKTGLIILALVMLIFIAPAASAEIYIHIGGDGVMNFTNGTPPRNYMLFMKEMKPRKRSPGSSARLQGEGAYEELIRTAAERHGLDVALIKAVIKAESDFDPNAVSPKGASGLMQIMPANFGPLRIDDPFDPAQCIMAGSRHLRDLWERFRNWRLALAAYNAGAMAVDQYGDIPPYPETEGYVDRVLGYYRKFNGQ
jgi:soluble lytic murein transglycosylase